MAFRGNQNRNRNFVGNNYGGPMGPNRMGGMNMSPWESQNPGGQFGNMRQGGGQGMNVQAINLANNLLNNLFRNQNPPSLLDLPRGGGGGVGGMGNRNPRGGPMVNRGGLGSRLNNNRRGQGGGFQNRGAANGPKSAQKQGAGGIRKQNAFDRAKKLLAKNANNKKKDNAAFGDKITDESKESLYASVPNDMFYCHLCKKHMWDANSFENHIKGRTHLMMREGIEESYRLKANMIRQEAKIAEQLKAIELDRLKRMGKSKQRQLDYCTMCDLNFHGHISMHRKSDGHLQLKKFLHPKCLECNKEFATRIDYDTHLLSADHLQNAAEKNTKVGEHGRQTLPINTEEDELRDVRPPQKHKKKSIKKKETNEPKKEGEEGAEGDEAGTGDADETKEGEDAEGNETKEGEELNESHEEEEVALPEDPEDVILDFVEGDEIPVEVDMRLPKYNWTRPVGVGLISKLECFECSLCSKFFDTENTVEVHSRTATHHRNFLRFLNEKSSDTKIAQKRAAAELEENERKKLKLDENPEGGEATAEAEGNAAEDNTDGNNDELYDPSEATGDDDELEANESCQQDGADDGAKDVGEEMGTQEEAEQENDDVEIKREEPEPEPETEPVSVKVETPKPEPAKTPTKPTPAAVIAQPATMSPTAVETSSTKKITPTRNAGPKSAPGRGGRGRGRYNRY